jgi:3',5'-cyclic-AMP phosphodiesterase
MIIAQITDFHIKARGRRAYGIVDTAAFLAQAVAALNALEPAPDLVVATGDLTDFGRAEEYELLRELLAPLALPLYAVPGNHDEREAMRRCFAGDGYLPASGFLNYVVEDLPVRLVALDTVVPGAAGGLLCDERLAWLDRVLAERRSQPTAIIMHHPPFRTGIAHMDAMGLDNAPAFAAIIARHPQVDRVLCGHLHRPIQSLIAGRAMASIAPSTAHQVVLDLRADSPAAFALEPPGYQLHCWADGVVVTHTAALGTFPGPYPFRKDGALID